jgi:hypothetical protein
MPVPGDAEHGTAGYAFQCSSMVIHCPASAVAGVMVAAPARSGGHVPVVPGVPAE